MTIEKFTVKLYRDSAGSIRIYIKKKQAELIGLKENTELLAEYDTEIGRLCIQDL
jgi:hypothetical protein